MQDYWDGACFERLIQNGRPDAPEEKESFSCRFVTFGGLPWLVNEITMITCLTLF
jgi:hypothetical protein